MFHLSYLMSLCPDKRLVPQGGTANMCTPSHEQVSEKREDGCHSPAQVLSWHKGTVYPESVLNRILFATRYTRHLDRHGYIRFQDWKLYGERGLAYQPVNVWI